MYKEKLKDVAEITMGTSPSGDTYNEDENGLPLLNGPTEFGQISPNCTLYTTDSKRECKGGDLIFCVRGSTTGRMNWADQVYSLGRGVCAFRGGSKLETKYIKYALDYSLRSLLKLAGGGTFPNLTKTTIHNFEIPYPDSRFKIASILSAFDNLIENNSRRIEILEEMARRFYREWFVHFRYPGHEDDGVVDSGTELGEIPEGWDMQVMDKVLEHYIGGTWGKEEPEDEKNNPAYVIRGTDIPRGRSGNVDDIPLRYHKQSYINSRKLQHGDIVFEVSGGSKDQPVGRAMLITDTFLSELDCDDVVHASFCKLLRSDESILKPEILYLHIREIYDDRRIMKYQVQSTGISNFKFTFFAENKQMFIPPMDLQKKFQEKVSPFFEQMYILGKQINRLKETRDLLLPKLISGKIDVGNFNKDLAQ